MNLTQAMKKLKAAGTEGWRKTLPYFGVRYADLYKIQKQIKRDHELALKLWETGNHDARILATLIVDPEAITARQLDAWIGVAKNHILNDAVSSVAAQSRHARKKADAWRKVKAEWKSAAGWNVVGYLAAPGSAADDAWLSECLAEIQDRIDGAANRTRHSMNNALISIGGYRPSLRPAAIATAKSIGKVEVDHGKTSCKTPDAVPYIRKMATRHKSVAGTKPGK